MGRTGDCESISDLPVGDWITHDWLPLKHVEMAICRFAGSDAEDCQAWTLQWRSITWVLVTRHIPKQVTYV